ncbi:MAG TPA: serine/threonine-protein kinase [Bacteriovoracaceae bacterium]|nr:serine/threonine-protein kinase [Bacteriovoracaceae bacterium]
MTDKKFQRFGKYLILDHLVDGGMAKICRARFLGEQANKVVAIKMVQPQFSNDEAFVRMFQDELNITFGMLHPNIMQVYDYGKTDGQLYTAMEYIHGANLKQFLDRLKEKKKAFPVEASCYIISQVCLGLHYAHTFTDKLTGKPYNIVHRDISPHNIMLTYDGAVKVIDFGIAKAETNSEATQAGTIKGKLSYLAPEYLEGLELDCRYDEFAVGITLWELLCSRKLFQAANDLAVLKQIQQCKIIPPSEINPTVPKELDEIVLKALSKDRANRYENLDQLNRALVKFLYASYPDFNPSDLRDFADDLFQKEITEDHKKFVEYGKMDIQPYIEDMKKAERTGKVSKKDVEAVKEVAKVREIDLEITEATGIGIEIDLPKMEGTATRKIARAQAAAPGAGTATKTMATARTRNSTSSVVLKRNQRDKSVSKTRKRKETPAESSKPQLFIFIAVASFAAIAYFKGDLIGFDLKKVIHGEEVERTISSVPKEDQRQPQARSRVEADKDKGRLVFSGLDLNTQVLVDGEKTEFGRPVFIPLNKEVKIVVRRQGYRSHVEKVKLTQNNNSQVINIPKLERSRRGVLSTSNNYTPGSKLIYEEAGEMIERQLPFNNVYVEEGTYQAKVVNPILGTEKKVLFKIEESKKHFLE